MSFGPVIIYGRGLGRRETILTQFLLPNQFKSEKFIYPAMSCNFFFTKPRKKYIAL